MNAAAGALGDTAIESEHLSEWTSFFINLNTAILFKGYFYCSKINLNRTDAGVVTIRSVDMGLNVTSFVSGKARETCVAARHNDL